MQKLLLLPDTGIQGYKDTRIQGCKNYLTFKENNSKEFEIKNN